MSKYIKYKRISGTFTNDDEVQNKLDEIIMDGWEIIYYNEHGYDMFSTGYVLVLGKLNEGVEKQIL